METSGSIYSERKEIFQEPSYKGPASVEQKTLLNQPGQNQGSEKPQASNLQMKNDTLKNDLVKAYEIPTHKRPSDSSPKQRAKQPAKNSNPDSDTPKFIESVKPQKSNSNKDEVKPTRGADRLPSWGLPNNAEIKIKIPEVQAKKTNSNTKGSGSPTKTGDSPKKGSSPNKGGNSPKKDQGVTENKMDLKIELSSSNSNPNKIIAVNLAEIAQTGNHYHICGKCILSRSFSLSTI